jgi:hypothetical protein
MRKDLVDAVRYPVEPMTTVISPWRCRRNDVRAIRLDALSMRRSVPVHIVNAKCCGDVLAFGESIASTDRQECGVRPMVVTLRKTLGRAASRDVAP